MTTLQEALKMTQRITAEEARRIVGQTAQEYVEEVYGMIREAVEKKQREIHLHGDFWAREGYSGTEKWKEACEILRKDGYTVKFYYMELQFVDMYTLVKW